MTLKRVRKGPEVPLWLPPMEEETAVTTVVRRPQAISTQQLDRLDKRPCDKEVAGVDALH